MRVARTYAGARAAAGPLLYVEGTNRAALGEWVLIEAPDGQVRRGHVIDAGLDVTVIQVLEDTLGLPPAGVRITLTGDHASTPVGRELLGRVLNGVGHPRDGLPEPVGRARRSVWGAPMNPWRRAKPRDFIETGISVIDGMNTLVRGQKLPVFSGPGLPGLDLAAQIVEGARVPSGEPFATVFAAIGITERESTEFLARFEASGAMPRSVVYLNHASDPTIERLLTPRVALTAAEHLAFAEGLHVLVVMADVTHYCEVLREIATAREEVPGRRGYPGYMYTDLATLFERAGLFRDGVGSVTQVPVLTVPDDDMTHPVADLTGYITEGQIVLDRDLHRRGVFPPVDVLPSLSRLMNSGIGKDRTVAEHRQWADQLYALYAQGREARLMAAIVGETGLSEGDRNALAFVRRFDREFVHQGRTRRTLDETLAVGWSLLETFPRRQLTRLTEAAWAARAPARPSPAGAGP